MHVCTYVCIFLYIFLPKYARVSMYAYTYCHTYQPILVCGYFAVHIENGDLVT